MSAQIILSNEFGQIQSLDLGHTIKGLSLKHDKFKATISLYGGQVLTWQPTDQKPIFWLSDDAQYLTGKAIRGGIPLCWPWFGPYQDGGNHGFARQQVWALTETLITAENITLILTWQGQNQHKLWPTPCELKQELILGKQFSQKLYMTNLSDKPVKYTGALHSYFAVSAPENITIEQLSAASFSDKLTDQFVEPQPLANCVGPIDRIYHTNRAVKMVDSQWQRVIEIESQHCQQWVLWNPGQQGAAAMSDVHLDGEQQFVCLEAANTQWQTIPAQSTVEMAQTVKIKSLG
ncbi:MAG: D-hexose-6-phosphate mutarotase [Colwellia sp.]|nr:D-hexose-6-phosphate mutarotase [Colwellia sp.]